MAHSHVVDKPGPSKTAVSPCTCETPPETATCCDLTCFDRPNYFCGHLLTDADLRKEQRYVVEKHKLYHRSLHGHGVVCGLRLTCDHHCPGHIRIGKGYAIDDCGNDLVVCKPTRFNVLGDLIDRKWIIQQPEPDPCLPKSKEPDCKIKQCFYVTACYEETPEEYTTPFVAGCRPSVSECEPTRIREQVRFDLLKLLPKEADPLEALRCRIEECFALLTKGPFAEALAKHAALLADAIEHPEDHRDSACHDAFCELRGLFLLHLYHHPDQYNCDLEKDIRAIPFPGDAQAGATSGAPAISQNDCHDAICALLELAYQHVMSCVMGELVFPCAEPCQASCVVLGTVEIEDGRLVRVCNCPRTYVWSFASFMEVLLATAIGGLACEKESDDDEGAASTAPGDDVRPTCCREFKFDCKDFLKQSSVNRQAFLEIAKEPARLLAGLGRSVRHAFDITQRGILSPGLFTGLSLTDAAAAAKKFDIEVKLEGAPAVSRPPSILNVLRAETFAKKGDSLVLRHDANTVINARRGLPPTGAPVPPGPSVPPELAKRMDSLEKQLLDAHKKVDEATRRVIQLEKKKREP